MAESHKFVLYLAMYAEYTPHRFYVKLSHSELLARTAPACIGKLGRARKLHDRINKYGRKSTMIAYRSLDDVTMQALGRAAFADDVFMNKSEVDRMNDLERVMHDSAIVVFNRVKYLGNETYFAPLRLMQVYITFATDRVMMLLIARANMLRRDDLGHIRLASCNCKLCDPFWSSISRGRREEVDTAHKKLFETVAGGKCNTRHLTLAALAAAQSAETAWLSIDLDVDYIKCSHEETQQVFALLTAALVHFSNGVVLLDIIKETCIACEVEVPATAGEWDWEHTPALAQYACILLRDHISEAYYSGPMSALDWTYVRIAKRLMRTSSLFAEHCAELVVYDEYEDDDSESAKGPVPASEWYAEEHRGRVIAALRTFLNTDRYCDTYDLIFVFDRRLHEIPLGLRDEDHAEEKAKRDEDLRQPHPGYSEDALPRFDKITQKAVRKVVARYVDTETAEDRKMGTKLDVFLHMRNAKGHSASIADDRLTAMNAIKRKYKRRKAFAAARQHAKVLAAEKAATDAAIDAGTATPAEMAEAALEEALLTKSLAEADVVAARRALTRASARVAELENNLEILEEAARRANPTQQRLEAAMCETESEESEEEESD